MRLIYALKDDPKKAMRQALCDSIIALTLAAGVIVTTIVISYVFAGSVEAVFIIAADAGVMATGRHASWCA
jgi:hypothetical protein